MLHICIIGPHSLYKNIIIINTTLTVGITKNKLNKDELKYKDTKRLTAATTAWCKQNVEVMLTVLACLKLHTVVQQSRCYL